MENWRKRHGISGPESGIGVKCLHLDIYPCSSRNVLGYLFVVQYLLDEEGLTPCLVDCSCGYSEEISGFLRSLDASVTLSPLSQFCVPNTLLRLLYPSARLHQQELIHQCTSTSRNLLGCLCLITLTKIWLCRHFFAFTWMCWRRLCKS